MQKDGLVLDTFPHGCSANESRPSPAYKSGDSVKYWSYTHQQELPAMVKQASSWDPANRQWLYDLDIKSGAEESKMKPTDDVDHRRPASGPLTQLASPTPVVNTALGGGHRSYEKRLSTASDVSRATVYDGAFHSPLRSVFAEEELTLFNVGDNVWYRSKTHGNSISDEILEVLQPGKFYKLVCKGKAEASCIHPRPDVAEGQLPKAPELSARARLPVNASTAFFEAKPRFAAASHGLQRPVATRDPGLQRDSTSQVDISSQPGTVSLGESLSSQLQGPSAISVAPKPRTSPTPAQTRAAEAHAGIELNQPVAGENLLSASIPRAQGKGSCQVADGHSTPSHSHVQNLSPPTCTLAQPSARTFFMGTGVERKPQIAGPPSPAVAAAGARPDAAAPQTTPEPNLENADVPAPIVAAPVRPVRPPIRVAVNPQMASTGLEGGDLHFGPAGSCDPAKDECLRTQLFINFGLTAAARIEEMQGFKGGLNEGVWYMKDPGRLDQDLVLKLVKCRRIASNVLTEAENFIKLSTQHRALRTDAAVAFPVKVFNCLDENGDKRHDLIVMKKVRGERLAEVICRKWYMKQFHQMYLILEKIGQTLSAFHSRYGNSQHGDFQPANIFYDEERDAVFLIDIGGMGVPCMSNDIEHFQKAMRLLAESYGQELQTNGLRHFDQGYRCPKKRGSLP